MSLVEVGIFIPIAPETGVKSHFSSSLMENILESIIPVILKLHREQVLYVIRLTCKSQVIAMIIDWFTGPQSL